MTDSLTAELVDDAGPGDQSVREVLERVVIALGDPQSLREVLRLIAEVACEATNAHHASVFVLDGRQLYPAIAVGSLPEAELWEAFRRMGPIDVDPERWKLFVSGQPVAIDDARTSNLIPRAWIERFTVRSIAMVALQSGGEASGLLTVDRDEVATFSPSELHVLQLLGRYAALAVSNARPYETVSRRARLQAALASAAAALASPLEPGEIIRRLVLAYAELLGSRSCAVALVDLDRGELTDVATLNTREIAAPIPLDAIPPRLIEHLSRTWAEGRRAVELGHDPWLDEFLDAPRAGVTSYLLLPLEVEAQIRGGVLLGFSSRVSLDTEELAAATSLATLTAAALERHELLKRLARQLRQLDALQHLDAVLREGSTADELRASLNKLLASDGIEVVDVTLRDRQLAQHVGGASPHERERDAWRSANGPVELPGRVLSVPIRLGARVVGALRVRPTSLDAAQLGFVEALGNAVADVASRGALRAAVEQGNRERAVAAERERMAIDLHDTAGQLFVAIGLLAGRIVDELPSTSPEMGQVARLVEVAEQGQRAIQDALRAAAFAPETNRGLVRSLQVLSRSFAGDSGLQVVVTVRGDECRLAADVERALYRVANEALMNAWRHARCTSVRIVVHYSANDVRLVVVDDGIGITANRPHDGREHRGLTGMRGIMMGVGGTLHVTAARPRGTRVDARVGRVQQ